MLSYAITAREADIITNNYLAVATIDNGIPDSTFRYYSSRMPIIYEHSYGWYTIHRRTPVPLTIEQVDELSSLSSVSSTETRYMTGGIINDYERFYKWEGIDYGFNYNARFIIEGTFSNLIENTLTDDEGYLMGKYNLQFRDATVLAGSYPLKENYMFNLMSISFIMANSNIRLLLSNEQFLFKNNPYNYDYLNNFQEGNKYILIGRYNTLYPEVTYLGDYDTEGYYPAVTDITGQPENYLELEEFSNLKNLIDITNKDLHTFDIVYTSDMRMIPYVNEQVMQVYEGRFLTPKDDTDNARVCVVSHAFFVKNNLSLGDKLTIGLGDKLFMQHAGMGAVTYIPERAWNIAETVELEIVGVYIDTNSPKEREAELYWGYHPCTIFVPKSLLPVDVPAEHEVWAGEFSVLVEDAYDITAFHTQAQALVNEWKTEYSWDYEYHDPINGETERHTGSMSVQNKLRFSDRGWSLVKDSLNTSMSTALASTIFYVFTSALGLLLVVYIYIRSNKKAYAIMRALGTPYRDVEKKLTLPFVTLSLPAILLGASAGCFYTSQNISAVLDEISGKINDYTADTSIPVIPVIICLLGVIIFTASLIILFMLRLRKIPIIEILQGDAVVRIANNIKYKAKDSKSDNKPNTIAMQNQKEATKTNLSEKTQQNYSSFYHIAIYILRHLLWVKTKTIISIMLTVVLMGATGFLVITMQLYKNLFSEINVIATTTNYSTDAIDDLLKSELIDDLYYYSDYVVFFEDITVEAYYLVLTNNFEHSINDSADEYNIEYSDNFSDTSFFATEDLLYSENKFCIIGSYFNVKPGEDIMVISPEKLQNLYGITVLYGDDSDEYKQALANEATFYKVAGVVTFKSEDMNRKIFAPMSSDVMHLNNNEHFPLEYSEFVLSDNEMKAELFNILDELGNSSRLYSVAAEYSMDTSELDNVKRTRDLFITAFPIIITVVILINMATSALLIIQSSKEAAVLRVLGTTKKRVRSMFAIEQVLLCILGMVIAATALVIYNAELFKESLSTLLLCDGLYFTGCIVSSITAAIVITRKKPLELLQVKE